MFAFAFVLSAERSHNYHSEWVSAGMSMGVNTHSNSHTQTWTQLYATDSVGSSIATIAHWTIGVHCTAEAAIDTAKGESREESAVGQGAGREGGRAGLWACWACNCGASRCRSTDNIWQTQMQTRIKNAQRDINDSHWMPGAMPAGRWLTSWEVESSSSSTGCNSSLRSRPFIWPGKHLHWPFSVNIDRFPCKFNTQTFGAALAKLKISSVQSGRRVRQVAKGGEGRGGRRSIGLAQLLSLLLLLFQYPNPLSYRLLAHFEQLPNGKAINYWPVSAMPHSHTHTLHMSLCVCVCECAHPRMHLFRCSGGCAKRAANLKYKQHGPARRVHSGNRLLDWLHPFPPKGTAVSLLDCPVGV